MNRYRYGFNGKENDNEVKGEGNQQDYGFRIYDPRIGKFLSVDPLTKDYPELTPYQFASNRPIDGIDQDGLEYFELSSPGQSLRDKARLQVDVAEAPKRQLQEQLNILMHKGTQGVTPSPVRYGIDKKLHEAQRVEMLRAKGLNADGSKQAWRALAENKTFKNFANNVALPMIEGALLDGASKLLFKGGTETFYRSMSSEAFENFKATGKMPAGSETFISPTEAFSQDYTGVLVKINVKSGTLSQLENIGVRNSCELINSAHGQLPLVSKGWKASNAFFKQETNSAGLQQINIGLGDGKALEIFNRNIKSTEVIRIK